MTREDLERTIAGMMDGAYSTDEAALEAARDAVRLVVEACCKKLAQEAEELGDEGDLYACAYLSAEADLRNTFLPTPTTEPTDG